MMLGLSAKFVCRRPKQSCPSGNEATENRTVSIFATFLHFVTHQMDLLELILHLFTPLGTFTELSQWSESEISLIFALNLGAIFHSSELNLRLIHHAQPTITGLLLIWVFHDKEIWHISVRLSDRSKVTSGVWTHNLQIISPMLCQLS